MAEVRLEEEIAAPAARVWELLSDFAGVDKWFPGAQKMIIEGEGIGATRRIGMGGGDLVERLESFDAEARTFSYAITESATPIESYLATISVRSIDAARCVVEWVTTFETRGIPEGPVAEGLEGAYRTGIRNVAKLAAE